MSEWKFLTADEIVKWYGERCGDTEPGCPTCAAWLRYDTLRQWEYEDINERIEIEKDEPPKTGIKVGVRFLNEAQDYALNGIMNTEENEKIDAEVNERLSYYSPEFISKSSVLNTLPEDDDEYVYLKIDAFGDFMVGSKPDDAVKKMFTRLMLERKIGDNEEEV